MFNAIQIIFNKKVFQRNILGIYGRYLRKSFKLKMVTKNDNKAQDTWIITKCFKVRL